MRNIFLFTLPFFLSCSSGYLQAETPPQKPENRIQFEPFTGKTLKDRVRLRLQSNYEGAIIRELKRNDLILILGETEDFYAIQPPVDSRGSVFRTYVLDNIIEGTRVNVRLKPDLDSPIIAQLKTGDRIEGNIAPNNNKWLEIQLPHTTRFYIAKEYVEKVGDAGFKTRFEKKREEIYHLLSTTNALSQAEIQKPFDQMTIEGLKANYQRVMFDSPEFPEASAKAKEGLAALQENYLSKKLAYLENQSQTSSSELNKKLITELQAQKTKIFHLEKEIEKGHQFIPSTEQPIASTKPTQLPMNMSIWLPIEEQLFNAWSQKHGQSTPQDFYDEQKQQAIVLRGVIDSYNRPVRNKPGDYMLLNPANQLPIAFLYSTHINLQDYVGHEVSLIVNSRDNHHFAFPAYFVLMINQ